MKIWKRRNSNRTSLSEALNFCLEQAAGDPEAARAAVERYPEYAAELESLLRASQVVRQRMAVPLSENRRLAARQQFLQAAARQTRSAPAYAAGRLARPGRTPNVLLRPLWSSFAPAAAAALLFVIALVPIMSITSVSSLPGDWNYGFKRSSERVRLALTLNPTDRLDLQLAFHSRRLGEIERLAADGRLTDPTLVQAFTSETSDLVRSVSDNPQLGPSEALKVAQQTQAQVQALSDRVAPLASASLKPVVDDAVQQSQEVHQRANEVAQAKEDSAFSHAGQTQSTSNTTGKSGKGTGAKSTLTNAATSTATASATGTAAAAGAATATATPAATDTPSPTATAAPASTATGAPQVALRPPPAPPLRPPSAAVSSGPALLVPPSQPPVSQQLFTRPLPAGQTTSFVYIGPELPIPQALSSINGAYDAVFYTQPRTRGGQVYEWYPGVSDPSIILEAGSQVSVHTKPGVSATLTFVIAPVESQR